VIRLRRIVLEWPEWRIIRLVDDVTGQAVMLVSQDHCCPHVINLSAGSHLDREEKTITTKTEIAIREFIDARGGWTQIVPTGGNAE
jgi:hypothetical protein